MKEKTDVDPKSIDLKEAYCMCSHAREYFAPENEGKQLTYKSNSFPLVIDWDYYDVSCMTHRWNDAKNAIACAKKVIKLRFKNYGKITVINNA